MGEIQVTADDIRGAVETAKWAVLQCRNGEGKISYSRVVAAAAAMLHTLALISKSSDQHIADMIMTMMRHLRGDEQKPDDVSVLFCVRCFADSDKGGSWGELVMAGGCMNCGASGFVISIPKWAVDNIRKSGSWVCKRYYPDKEDREMSRELRFLRSKVTDRPGLTVKLMDPERPNHWSVEQVMPDGSRISTYVDAPSEDAAVGMGMKQLPYPVPGPQCPKCGGRDMAQSPTTDHPGCLMCKTCDWSGTDLDLIRP